MTADEFAKIVKSGSDKLRVDEVTVETASGNLSGRGVLHVTTDELVLHLTVDDPTTLPCFRAGVYTARDFWKLRGVIDEDLHFRCTVPPAGCSRTRNGITTIERRINPIELVASGVDRMNRAELAQYLRRVGVGDNSTVEYPAKATPGAVSVRFEASLAGYPLIACDSGTDKTFTNSFLGERSASALDTLSGEVETFKYALIKEDADVSLYIISKPEAYVSESEESDERIFRAFLAAIAFTHGVHAWPYRVQHWRDGRKVCDRVTARRPLQGTDHAPFSEQLALNALTGRVEWDLRNALRNAFSFFYPGSLLSREVSQIAFLFREAGKKHVHAEISTLALCTLFENIVRLLFRHKNLNDESSAAFKKTQAGLAELMSQHDDGSTAHARLTAIVKSAPPVNIEGMFRAVVQAYGLKWEGDMRLLFRTWKDARNPLVHESNRVDRDEHQYKDAVHAQSRIAGAINVLLLKEMGYSGYVRCSTFEDKYRTI